MSNLVCLVGVFYVSIGSARRRGAKRLEGELEERSHARVRALFGAKAAATRLLIDRDPAARLLLLRAGRGWRGYLDAI